MSVRRQALLSVHACMLIYHNQPNVLAAYLTCVLPLVLDREDSVKAKCQELLFAVCAEPLTSPDSDDNQDNQFALSWNILAQLSQVPELRGFFRRSVSAWADANWLQPALLNTVTARCELHPADPVPWLYLSELAPFAARHLDSRMLMSAWLHRDPAQESVNASVLQCLSQAVQQLGGDSASQLVDDLQSLLTLRNLSPSLAATAFQTLQRMMERQDLLAFAASLIAQGVPLLEDIALQACTGEAAVQATRGLFALGECCLLAPKHATKVVKVVEAIIARPATTTVSEDEAIVRAHAYLALGKVCLQDEDLAKKWLNSMTRELSTCEAPAVRNNLVIILSDLCVRYPTMVAQYLPTLCTALTDPSPLIRRQTLTLLTRLLTEDFVKLREALLFNLLLMLVDEEQSVRQLALYCLMQVLNVKMPNLFASHFVESLFFFNNYEGHAKYNRFEGRSPSSVAGLALRTKREYMYRLMLEQMTDVDKLQVTQTLCQDILGAIVDGQMTLDPASEPLLQDALTVLASKDIKIGKTARDDDEEDTALEVAQKKVKAALVSKVAKKTLVESIVPIMISLKTKLEAHRSPLQRALLFFLREVMRDHKDDMEDVMAANRQLAAEITYDLKALEAEDQSRRGSISSLAGTPSMQPPTMVASPKTGTATPLTPRFTAPQLRRSVSEGSGRPSLAGKDPAVLRLSFATHRTASPLVAGQPRGTSTSTIKAPTPRRNMATTTPAAVLKTPRATRSSTAAKSNNGPIVLKSPLNETTSNVGARLRTSMPPPMSEKRVASHAEDDVDELLVSPAPEAVKTTRSKRHK
eukprot:TRINITY_DN10470_c0_g1_i2.p1 TRINITY_DN10470_c0_g1~~TRINITY_DN10470_c0_g1_i2.p1  ORF type:complete len:821 (+),score=281.91 TRINITY_DN10470_c0_g1_i2:31-2463(+)